MLKLTIFTILARFHVKLVKKHEKCRRTKVSDSSSEGFEPQDVGKDTVPKGSLSGDEPLIGPFGPRKPVSQGSNTSQTNGAFQGSNAFQKLSQQSKREPATDPKKLPQVRVDELQRTRTDELPRTRTDELKEEKNYKSSQRQKIIENPLNSKFADPEEYIQQKSIKTTLNEEVRRRKNFERNLNKLALFAYEAEEGADMLESGQNPFLEEVNRMLQEIDNEGESFSKEVDRLLEEIDSGTEPLAVEVDRLLQEIGSGTRPLLEKKYEDLKQLNQQRMQKNTTDSSDPSLQEQRRNKGTLGT